MAEEVTSETPTVKKTRGNPNFKKGADNPYYKKGDSKMAETATEEVKEVKPAEPNASAIGEEKKVIPSNIFDEKIPDKPVLPLDDEVETKAYATISEEKPNEAGKTTDSGTSTESTTSSTTSDGGASGPAPTTTPTEQPLTPEEQQTQAAQTVAALIKMYEKMHGVGRWMAKKDPAELLQMHMKGEINLNRQLPLGDKVIQVKDFFNQYNNGIDEAICVDQEFKDNITPPLTRIAIKRKWFLGDELYVGMLVAEDLATKASLLIGLTKSANLVLQAVKDMEKGRKKPASPEEATQTTVEAPAEDGNEWREEEVQP